MARIRFKCLCDSCFADIRVIMRFEYFARYIESIGLYAELHRCMIGLHISIIVFDDAVLVPDREYAVFLAVVI